ncbi:unnamed protein product [Urochloa decumbens]|uniref:F-box domain-containing protein n=1 Tax=Urochloa decumbens TaxID=240449 RepID=A0ABC9DJM5_9POAL
MASGLPEDILLQIFAVLDVPDLVRAGSVCSAWHGAYTSLCSLGCLKQSQTPCLLYTAKSRGQSAAGLYSLAEKKPYTLALPDPPIRSRYFLGSAYGWIITADERSELHLLNPITGDQIALPSVTTFEHVTPIYDKNGTVEEYSSYCALPGPHGPSTYSLSKLREFFFHKAFLSSDPSTGDYIVVVIHNTYYRLSFARSGDDRWTSLPPQCYFADCIFKDGLMYAVNGFGAIHVFDFSEPVVKQKVILEAKRDYIFERVYVVQTPCGDLMQIWSDVDWELEAVSEESEPDPLEEDDSFSEPDLPSDYEPSRHHCTPFKLFKVDLTANKLVEISSLGENVLFIGQNQTVCLNAQEHPQLKANHIYFTDNDEYAVFARKNMIRDIGVLNLCDNSKEKITSPQIWSNWPSPVWITPNLRKMNSDVGGSTEETARAQAPPSSSWTVVFAHGWSVAFVFLLFSLLMSWFM